MIKLPHFIRYPKQHSPLNWLVRPKRQKLSRSAGPIFHDGALADPGHGAIDQACQRLELERAGHDRPVGRRYSVGAAVADPDGGRYWLKVAGYKDVFPDKVREKLLGPPAIVGVPMPSILKTAEWTFDGIHWLAMQMALAPSPAIEKTAYAKENAGSVSDRWITSLKAVLERVAASNIDAKHRTSPERIRHSIVRRWGEGAPHMVDDWRFAHGDLHWSNVTAPHLMLLDWSERGLAPRGYDAAKLVICALYQPDLVRRLEEAFADDLESRSGRAAMLLLAANRLDRMDADCGSKRYRTWLHEKAERILAGR